VTAIVKDGEGKKIGVENGVSDESKRERNVVLSMIVTGRFIQERSWTLPRKKGGKQIQPTLFRRKGGKNSWAKRRVTVCGGMA